MFDRSIVLNNGVKIPQLGLGTWFIDDDKAADAVKAAVEIGYRHIDTAQAYGNERGVGEGVRTCGIPREELFVVSKVAAEHKTYEEAMAGINETLEKMGLDYLDMMIIHSPQPWAKVNQCEDRYIEGNRAASPVVIERIPARTRLVSFQLRFFKIPIVDQITVVFVFPCQNIIIETLFPVDIINGILYLLLLRQ